MNLGHPALKDMINFGCNNKANILLAFQTYMELCEVYKEPEVLYSYCQELDVIYLIASTPEGKEIYLPLSQNDSISPQKINSYQKLCKDGNGKGIHIVIRDVDTSCVIYKMSYGLDIPLSPETSKKKKEQKEKKNLIENEIVNLLPKLIQEARSNQN